MMDSQCISGKTDLAQLIRDHPWEMTTLGPMSGWSPVLCTMVNLVLSSPVATVLHWGPSLLAIYNDRYVSILGGKHPDALGMPASEIWSQEWALVGEDYEATFETGLPRVEEQALIPVESLGRFQDAYWNYVMTPISENGRIVGILKTCQNVTEEVMTRNALVESDDRFRLALSATDCIGTWDWHIQPDMVYSEERFAKIFGARPDLAPRGVPLGSFLDNIHREDRVAVEMAIVRALDSGNDYLAEYRLIQADGSVRWVEAKGRCIYTESGLPLRFPGIVFDITIRKERESLAPSGSANNSEGAGLSLTDGSSRSTKFEVGNSPRLRREEVVRRLDELLKGRSETGSEGSQIQHAEAVLALLAEGLLLEQHFAQAEAVPVGALADAAIAIQKELVGQRGPFLVTGGPDPDQRNAHLAHLLHAVWSLLGEAIRNLGITPA